MSPIAGRPGRSEPSTLAASWTRRWTPARDALRTFRRAALLVLGLGAVGLAAPAAPGALAPNADRGAALRLAAEPGPIRAGLAWSSAARTPEGTSNLAVGRLLDLVEVLGWVAFAVAAVSILAVGVAQMAARADEVSVRRAVGASRRGLLASHLLEGTVLALVAVPLGIALARFVAIRGASAWPADAAPMATTAWLLPAGLTAGLLLLAAVGVSVGSRGDRIVDQRPEEVGLAVPIVQIALSSALLVAAALVIQRARSTPELISPVIADDVSLLLNDLPEDLAARSERLKAMLGRLGEDGRFDTVHLTSPGQSRGLGTIDAISTDCGACPAAGVILRWHHLSAVHHVVSPDTFQAEGLRVVEGRGFTSRDDIGSERVAVINRAMASNHFEAAGAIGRPLYLARGFLSEPYRVVGIVADRPSTAFGGPSQPVETVYLSAFQHPPDRAELLLRPASGAPLDTLRGALAPALSDARIERTERLERRQERGVAVVGWFGRSFGLAGLATLLAAVVGLAAVLGLWIASRHRELMLRRAVGSTRVRLLGYVLARVGGALALGLVLGLFVFASVLWAAFDAVLEDFPLADGRVFLTVTGAVVVTALAATLGPLGRLVRATPSEQLH